MPAMSPTEGSIGGIVGCDRVARPEGAMTAGVPSKQQPEDDMHLDIHVPRFTWPGGPEAIGPTFATLAETAESIGVRTLSVMDHWFQMEMLWPAGGAAP